MTLTKEQLISKLAPRIENKLRRNIVWGTVTSAVAAASSAQKDAIVNALKAKNYVAAGGELGLIIQARLEEDAVTNITSALANDSLNLSELSEILE